MSTSNPEPFQIFVKGLEGKSTTYTVKLDTTILELKKMVYDRVGVECEHQRLIFAGKPLADDKTIMDYGIQKHSTLHLVIRLLGGNDTTVEKVHDPDSDIELTEEPDMITWEDDKENLRAKMPCGHAIGPMSLTAFCRSLVTEGKFQFFCPYVNPDNNERCRLEWQYTDIRKFGLLTDEECEFFETRISENYALRAIGIQECPKCSTCCERTDKHLPSVICRVCSKKKPRTEFAFCWFCLSEVKRANGYRCNNNECGGIDPRLAILKNATKKTVGYVSGVPSCRACLSCGTIIEHDRNCKHMKCRCGQQFCFVCLSIPQGDKWSCGSPYSTCPIAPVQTTIPGL